MNAVVLDESARAQKRQNSDVLAALLTLGWFKTFSISGFMLLFFSGYFYLLQHPAFPVRTIPATWLDGVVPFLPAALPVYLSLWLYVSLPPALMITRMEIVGYGLRIGALCLAGFAVFYFWPNAIAPPAIDWKAHPSVAFLKRVDTAGNAFPSLHVATAVFSALWLHWRLGRLRLHPALRAGNAAWCLAIAWSTLAIKQHVALDVAAGATLGAVGAWALRLRAHAGRVDSRCSNGYGWRCVGIAGAPTFRNVIDNGGNPSLNHTWRYPADLLRNLLLGMRAAVLWRVPLEQAATGSMQIAGALLLNLLPWFIAQRIGAGPDSEFTPAGLPGIWFPFTVFVVVVAVAMRLLRRAAWAAPLVMVLLNANIAIDVVVCVLPLVAAIEGTIVENYLGDIAGYWLALVLLVLLVRLCGWRDWRGGLVAAGAGVVVVVAINHVWQTTTLWYEPYDPAQLEREFARNSLDEEILYLQPGLLEKQLQRLQPGKPGRADLYFLGVAGDSAQKVFLREIRSIYQIMLGRFVQREHGLLLVNHPETLRFEPIATVTSIEAAVQRFAQVMQRDEDVLFIYLTSHGSQEDGVALSLPPLKLQQLQPAVLRRILDQAGIRWRVIVVSACHSGVFVEPLADDHTLVITAAAADRASFGCADENDYTYFGRAYFEDALPESDSFIEAFARARGLVTEREQAEGETPSLPQISVGRDIADKLKTLQDSARK